MSEQDSMPLLVELFLANGRIQGLTREVHDRQRLIDVLGGAAQALRLESARVLLGAASTTRDFASLNVEKRSILAAIPHETKLQQRERSVLTTTVGRSQTHAIQATLIVPPLIAEGFVHVPQSFGGIGSKLTADGQIFGRFISVTNATLTLPGGTELDAPVLLVNRDLIAAISVPEEARGAAAAPAGMAPARAEPVAYRREGD